jgi:hypothetical protein
MPTRSRAALTVASSPRVRSGHARQAGSDIEAQADPATLGARLRPFRLRPAYITKRGFPNYPNFVEGVPAVACADSDNPNV